MHPRIAAGIAAASLAGSALAAGVYVVTIRGAAPESIVPSNSADIAAECRSGWAEARDHPPGATVVTFVDGVPVDFWTFDDVADHQYEFRTAWSGDVAHTIRITVTNTYHPFDLSATSKPCPPDDEEPPPEDTVPEQSVPEPEPSTTVTVPEEEPAPPPSSGPGSTTTTVQVAAPEEAPTARTVTNPASPATTTTTPLLPETK
jgi:hypothetical protein